MKIHLTDTSFLCCPEEMRTETPPEGLTERVMNSVMAEIKPEKGKKVLRTALIAAVIAALMTAAAFAAVHYSLLFEKADETIKTESIVYGENGEILDWRKEYIPEAGLKLSVTGPDGEYYLPEFRCYYLPHEPQFACTDSEGWTNFIIDSAENYAIPFNIYVQPLSKGVNEFIITGKPEIIGEKYWDDWYVLSVTSDYKGSEHYFYANDRLNYVILLNEEKGWMINVVGSDSVEELEKIAAGLEIRESGRLYNNISESSGCSVIGVGIG